MNKKIETMKILGVAMLLCCSMQAIVQAQSTDSVFNSHRVFQVSLCYPVGTNGVDSYKYTNSLSYNALLGYNKGVKGVEIGCFANTVTNDVQGLQIAGFSNVVLGNTYACQIAGFSNVTKKHARGIQIAGCSNVVTDSSKSVHIAGCSNVITGNLQGVSISGFSNVSLDTLQGIQIAGFSNVVKGAVSGGQIAGFSNVTCNSLQGFQIAGFSNVCTDSVQGIQLAGFSNISTSKLQGIQISGGVNLAQTLHGVQLGIVNISDSIAGGVPIGYFSYARNGYHAIDISADASQHIQVSFSTGVPVFYNVFSAGMYINTPTPIATVGYGVGTMKQINDKFDVAAELLSQSLITNTWYVDYSYSLHTASLQCVYGFTEKIKVFGGLQYNVFTTYGSPAEQSHLIDDILSYKPYTLNYSTHSVSMYPGAKLGLRITF